MSIVKTLKWSVIMVVLPNHDKAIPAELPSIQSIAFLNHEVFKLEEALTNVFI